MLKCVMVTHTPFVYTPTIHAHPFIHARAHTQTCAYVCACVYSSSLSLAYKMTPIIAIVCTLQ